MDTSRNEAITVLVVDDTAAKRYVICSWLRRGGYAVVEAASAREARERLDRTEVDLVILDVRLPDMSGLELCAQIKEAPATESLPVIHISATAIETTDRTRGLRRGADAYLTDPIDPEEFLATVEAVLRYSLARRRAEQLAAKLAVLTEITLEVNSAESFDELAMVAARGIARLFGAPSGAFLLPMDGLVRRTICVGPEAEPWARPCPSDALRRLAQLGSLGERTGSEIVGVRNEVLRQILPDTTADSDVGLVISRTKADRPPTCLGVELLRPLSAEDEDMLRQLGQTVALSMEALRNYHEEHAIALTLQRSLLPQRLPRMPGWSAVVRYEPASDQAEVGGDFYEVIDLGDRVLVAIGDVQGHSLRAATIMGELRHALRAFAVEGHDAETILNRLNSVMHHYHPDQTATVEIVTLDPATGDLQVANAGHLAPLFHHEGRTWFGKGGGVLLGFPVSGVNVENAHIPPGGGVALFTDGLIEERDVLLEDNLERLRRLPVDPDPDKYSAQIINEFGSREDDVALIILNRHPA